MDLTKKERLFLANQLKILEKLYPEEADYYSKHRKAIEEGYKLHYEWIVEHFGEEMSEDECREVLEILDMHRALTFSFKKLGKESAISKEEIRFRGFDGNHETNRYAYVQYFVIDLGRFDELREGLKYPDFNSHSPMTGKYRRMLAVWKGHQRIFELSEDQIKQIIEA